jgi:hypothetical protein
VADAAAGKQVRCQQCQTAFVAAAPSPAPAAVAPLAAPDPFAPRDPLGRANPLGSSNPLGGGSNPLGTLPGSSPANYYPAAPSSGLGGGFGGAGGVSNPSGGPTDAVMRMVCGGMLAGGLLMVAITVGMLAHDGSVYVALVALAPLAILLGIAGLISPNVVRAVGKYGGHLSWQYKAAGYAVLGVYFVILVVILIAMFTVGFQPDRPGLR